MNGSSDRFNDTDNVIDISNAEVVKTERIRIRRKRFPDIDDSGNYLSGNDKFIRLTDPDNLSADDDIHLKIPDAEQILAGKPVKRRGRKSKYEIQETGIDETIEGIDWGEYNPEEIVDLLMIFANKISGPSGLIDYQKPVTRRIFTSIVKNEGALITLMISRQAGKSHTLGAAAVTLCVVMPALAKHFPDQLGAYSRGFLVGIYAPTGDKARAIWDRATVMAKSSYMKEIYEDPEIATEPGRFGLTWSNGSRIFMAPANERANPESKTHHFIVVDEAQDMKHGVIEGSIEPMLAFTNGTLCLIGIPPDRRNYFDECIEKNVHRFITGNDVQNHFEYNYLEVIKHLPSYKRHINQMISRHGVDSPYFRRHYGLERMYSKGQAILDSDFKSYMMYERGKQIIPATEMPVIVSIDVAKEQASTVVTVGMPVKTFLEYDDIEQETVVLRIINWYEISGVDYTIQRHHIKAFLKGYKNIPLCVVDTTGVGNPFLEGLKKECSFIRKFEPFIFSVKSKQYLMELFYEYFWSRRIMIPSDDNARRTSKWQRFYIQMLGLQIHERSGGKYLGKKEGYGNQDDYADSLFLNIHGAELYLGKTSRRTIMFEGEAFTGNNAHSDKRGVFKEPLDIKELRTDYFRKRLMLHGDDS